jgi:hypothetical protein
MKDEDIVPGIAVTLLYLGGMAWVAYLGRKWARGDRSGGQGKRAESDSKVGEVLLNVLVVLASIAAGAYAVHEGKATWEQVTFGLGGFGVFWIGISYWNLEKEGPRLAQAWRAYAAKHGDRVDVPGRFAFLSLINATEAARQVMHAKLKGVRHGVEFEADITSHAPEEVSEKGTSFHASPGWMPKGGGVTLTHGYVPKSMGVSSPPPTLERHGAYVFAEPPALAAVFQTEEGDRALLEFSKKLPPELEVTAFRHGKSRAVAMIVTFGWCDEEKELEDTIDVLTRICALSPATDISSRERS